MNPGTSPGAMPEKLSVMARPMVTAGLAKDVLEVKKAAPIPRQDQRWAEATEAGPGQGADQGEQAGCGDDLAEPLTQPGALLRGEG